MVKTLARKKKTLRLRSGPAKKKSVKKTMKRAVRKVMGKKKLVKKVTKKVTKKLVKKVMAKKKSSVMAGTVGKVVHYYDKIGVAILELTAPLTVGELLTFQRGDRELFTQPISSMQINHADVEKAKKGDVVGVKVVQVADSGTMALRA
ncbi:MAG: hypothetical protein HOO67_04200 [Candidatus Peribacteraceae bacterium]|nr:hypothetical protein [Candidatus Peribacteraceae bacterium]